MVGLATRLLIAQRTAAGLKAAGAAESAIIEANSQWYYFGALGPALGDFVPIDPAAAGVPAGGSPYFAIWKTVLRIAVGDTTTGITGVVPVLRTFDQFIGEVADLVADHDFGGLKDMRDSGRFDVIKEASKDLGAVVAQFSDRERLKEIGRLMGENSRPFILNSTEKVSPSLWTGRDWLHWKHPGRFASALRERAALVGDDRFIAYALGWTVAYSALVCGSGFMNSLVGASYRNQWWRSRFVGNFVDTWTWGFYGAKAAMQPSDTPTPAYPEWPGLCGARLDQLIDLTGGLDAETTARKIVADEALPQVLPAQFLTFWLDAWSSTYDPQGPPLFTADRLQTSYLLLWITLWFQTSGQVIGCNPVPSAPPDACGDDPTPPDWVDPTQINPDTDKPYTAPMPNAKHDPDVAEIVSGIVLALAGVVATFLGGAAVGIPALAGGIGMIVDGEKNLNWDELECHMYWLRVYLYNGLDALHKLAVYGGMQHPYPAELELDEVLVKYNGGQLSYLSAASVCKSRSLDGMHLPWDGALSTWTAYPINGLEQPTQDVWALSRLWPSAIVDDEGANPATADIALQPAAWPGGVQGSFGPAVPASMRLIRSNRVPPDWNLDGDRGRGWLTWELDGPYLVPVPAVPEKT